MQTPVHLLLGLSGLGGRADGIRTSSDRVVRIELPTITPEHVDLMVKDLSTIGRLASTDKAAMAEICNAVAEHDLARSHHLATKFGLTEENLATEGGAIIGLMVGALAVAIIILAATTSPNPGPGPGPDAPNATISDAGSG